MKRAKVIGPSAAISARIAATRAGWPPSSTGWSVAKCWSAVITGALYGLGVWPGCPAWRGLAQDLIGRVLIGRDTAAAHPGVPSFDERGGRGWCLEFLGGMDMANDRHGTAFVVGAVVGGIVGAAATLWT